MCGIAGKLLFDAGARVDPVVLTRMTDAIRHRGPDDGGVWTEGPVGLGSRRLAVIDLSPRGHQPMASADGSLQVVFNGEIYNFRELRAELERDGWPFRSDTDTEVLLAAYATHGPAMVSRLRGMFAFALWDGARRQLMLARDRLGKKPLFYYQDARTFVFASEPCALLQDPDVPAEPDHEALGLYLGLGYVPAPYAAFRNVRKLQAAHIALVADGRIREARYWTPRYQPRRTASLPALAEELRARVTEAVRLRLISDVPVGALLSGGLDSSVVVALMAREHGRVRTFSIGFEQAAYDERHFAREVSRHFGTDHRELIVDPASVVTPEAVAAHYGEPFADSSAIPSLAVCALARRDVTVALSGDGGDESFMGYERYLALDLAGRLARFPGPLVAGLSACLSALPAGGPKTRRYRLRRFAGSLGAPVLDRYLDWTLVFGAEARRTLTKGRFDAAPESLMRRLFEESDAEPGAETAARADLHLYLPDDLLVKMDVASMAHSLEVRSPLLDHEVVEFAATVPVEHKLKGRTLKHLLRAAFADLLPPVTLSRAKMGFGVPLEHWFRGHLKDYAYDVLLGSAAAGRGYFEQAVVRQYLDDHVAGRAHHHHRLWALLMLELWHRQYIDRRPAPVAVDVGLGR